MELTQEIVKELLDYDPATGKLRWKERSAKWFEGKNRDATWLMNAWNSKFANKEAFTARGEKNRHHGNFLGSTVKPHRLIWLWMTGSFPKGVIDHKNGNAEDNRWENLRDTTQFENARNLNLAKNNTSGVTGVWYHKLSDGWYATIKVNYKKINLGYFKNKEDAIAARKAAEVKYGFTCR